MPFCLKSNCRRCEQGTCDKEKLPDYARHDDPRQDDRRHDTQTLKKIKVTSRSKSPGIRGFFAPLDKIDPRNFDAYTDREIKSCQQNISDGYAVKSNTQKLENIIKAKEGRRKIIEQHNGLDWDSIQRLKELRSIEESVEKRGNPCKEIKNIKAIIAAYESGALKFDGSATYWCQGKMLGKAAGFDITHVQELNTEKNRGDGGFWAEGIPRNLPQTRKGKAWQSAAASENRPSYVYYDLAVRLDHRLASYVQMENLEIPPECEWEYQDDTGATILSIYRDDVYGLMGNEYDIRDWPLNHVMGYQDFLNADGTLSSAEVVLALEVNMYTTDSQNNKVLMRDEWVSVPAAVFNSDRFGDGSVSDRLAGPFIYNTFWIGSAPTRRKQLFGSDIKSGLGRLLPSVATDQTGSVVFNTPHLGAAWERSNPNRPDLFNNLRSDDKMDGWTPQALLAQQNERQARVVKRGHGTGTSLPANYTE